MNRIYDEMSLADFPLMIDLKELDITGNKYFAIDDLRTLLARHKKLPVILETSLKQCMFSRFYFPLLEEFENLYIETSGLLLMDQLEHYVERFGSKRLIFGSNYPANDISVNTSRIELMESSRADIDNICSGNINRIFNAISI
jgi:predicted TIM-barrel fold metal-dependent hydrolase